MLEGVGGVGQEIGMVRVAGRAGGGGASTMCSECSVDSVIAADAAGWEGVWLDESMAMVEQASMGGMCGIAQPGMGEVLGRRRGGRKEGRGNGVKCRKEGGTR